jgi:coiled-coil domain-containing protein 12
LIRTSSGDPNQPVLINRTFDPETRTLRKHQTNVEMEDTLESNVKGLAEQIIAEDEAKRAQDLVTVIFFSIETSTPFTLHVKDLLNIAPKRPNWDLKREMEKKVARLERQTQQAIHTLIRKLRVTSLCYPLAH